jgi:hypothetical protein
LEAWGKLVPSPPVVDEGLLLPPPPHAVNKTKRNAEVILDIVRDIFSPMTKKLPDQFLLLLTHYQCRCGTQLDTPQYM